MQAVTALSLLSLLEACAQQRRVNHPARAARLQLVKGARARLMNATAALQQRLDRYGTRAGAVPIHRHERCGSCWEPCMLDERCSGKGPDRWGGLGCVSKECRLCGFHPYPACFDSGQDEEAAQRMHLQELSRIEEAKYALGKTARLSLEKLGFVLPPDPSLSFHLNSALIFILPNLDLISFSPNNFVIKYFRF